MKAGILVLVLLFVAICVQDVMACHGGGILGIRGRVAARREARAAVRAARSGCAGVAVYRGCAGVVQQRGCAGDVVVEAVPREVIMVPVTPQCATGACR